MVAKLFKKTTGSVRAAAAVLALATLASRFVGILRDRLLSSTFGAGAELDAYYAAFRTPDFIYNLFVLGAITAGFIPIFTEVLARDRQDVTAEGVSGEASDLASALMTVMGVGLVVLATLGIVLAPQAVSLLTPGFGPQQRELAVSLTRIMFFSPVFLGLSSVLGGILQTKRRFFVYATAPVMYNIGIIMGTWLLAPHLGIRGAAIGVSFGAFAHFLSQAFACWAAGYRWRWRWSPRDANVVAVFKQTVPRVVSLAISQINLFIMVGMASVIGTGSIAVVTLATNLQNFPVGILGVSFAVAAFPLISELAARGNTPEMVKHFTRTVRTVLFLVIPATVLMLLLRAQIVRVVLGAGRFDWTDTIDTANTLALLTVSLAAQALYPLVVRMFFALKDVRTPLFAGLAAVVVERVLAWQLVQHGYGTPGLAAAFSVGCIFDLFLLWFLLKLRLGSLGEKNIVLSLLRTSVAGLLMALTIQFLKAPIAARVDMQTFWGIFTQGMVSGLAGLAVYMLVALLLGSKEARDVATMYRRKRPSAAPVQHVVQDQDTIVVDPNVKQE